MLAVSRPVCRRTLGRFLSTAVESTPSAAPEAPLAPRARRRETTPTGNGRLFIKPWDGIPSMPDALAMVRAVERRYGRLKSFKIIRDQDVTTQYTPYLWAELENPSNFQGSETIKVPRPDFDRHRPGGVGLDNLNGLLAPHEQGTEWDRYQDELAVQSDKEQRYFELRVELSAAEEPGRARHVGQNSQFLVSDAFLKWGGFAPPSERTASSSRLQQVLKKSRIVVEEHKSDLEALADQGLPNLDLVEPPPPPPEPTPFNYEFDEVVETTAKSVASQSQPQARKVSSASSVGLAQSIREKEMNGIPLNKRERALKQAALLARSPKTSEFALRTVSKPPPLPEAPVAASEKVQVQKPAENRPPPKARSPPKPRDHQQTERERKGIQDKLWNIVGGKWF